MCALLEAQKERLKKEDGDDEEKKGKGVKRELPTSSTVSPNKKLASDLEKKMKTLPGDTSLVKAGQGYDIPEDGLPSIEDWIHTFQSILIDGLDLGREPVDVSVRWNWKSTAWKPGIGKGGGGAPSDSDGRHDANDQQVTMAEAREWADELNKELEGRETQPLKVATPKFVPRSDNSKRAKAGDQDLYQ
eukprot:s204_g25.t1